jgi:pilus assembly protein CpaB
VDITRGTTITAEMLKTRDYPKDMPPAGALGNVDDAVGRVTFTPLVKEESVLDGKLAPKGAGRGMAALTLKGMRSVTIQTPNVSSGVAGFILPGNKVDVLLTVNNQGAQDASGGTTTRLLQNVEILAVDQRLDAPAENKMDAKELRSVTLLVTPDQDAMLALAQTKGTLHLSLRNSNDNVDTNSRPVTLADLRLHREKLETAAPSPAPAAVTPPPPPVQIRTVRGVQEGEPINLYPLAGKAGGR